MNEERAIYLLRCIGQQIAIYDLQQMTQKYYHNNYKQLLGIDQSRTASEKLLDRAIGVIKKAPPEIKEGKQPEKKVKEEHYNLTHGQVLKKLLKNIETNNNASKLLKPITILKKCLEDQTFIHDPEINSSQQWNSLLGKMICIDERAIGNYSEVAILNDTLLQVLTLLQKQFKYSQKKEGVQVKEEGQSESKVEENRVSANNQSIAEICHFQILYYKLFTDDNFAFQKTLSELKTIIFNYFQQKLEGKESHSQLFEYLQDFLMKMFKLPFKKYEWVKNSLTQFFKQFNINYKHLLDQQLSEQYLQNYNAFINAKSSKGNGEDVSVFGIGNKGKVTHVQVVKGDGYDSWASRQ